MVHHNTCMYTIIVHVLIIMQLLSCFSLDTWHLLSILWYYWSSCSWPLWWLFWPQSVRVASELLCKCAGPLDRVNRNVYLTWSITLCLKFIVQVYLNHVLYMHVQHWRMRKWRTSDNIHSIEYDCCYHLQSRCFDWNNDCSCSWSTLSVHVWCTCCKLCSHFWLQWCGVGIIQSSVYPLLVKFIMAYHVYSTYRSIHLIYTLKRAWLWIIVFIDLLRCLCGPL